MRKISAFLYIISVLAFPLILCSCTSDTSGSVYELTSRKWQTVLEGGAEIRLEFSEDIAELAIKSGDEQAIISGSFAADGESLVIFDDEHYQNYFFTYEVKGEKLELSRDCDTITLEAQ